VSSSISFPSPNRQREKPIRFLADIIKPTFLPAPILSPWPHAARFDRPGQAKMTAPSALSNPSAFETFSEHLAIIEIAIMKLQDSVDRATAGVTPSDVSWSDVDQLAGIVQALRQAGLVTTTR
jgi:hypothetical protein